MHTDLLDFQHHTITDHQSLLGLHRHTHIEMVTDIHSYLPCVCVFITHHRVNKCHTNHIGPVGVSGVLGSCCTTRLDVCELDGHTWCVGTNDRVITSTMVVLLLCEWWSGRD